MEINLSRRTTTLAALATRLTAILVAACLWAATLPIATVATATVVTLGVPALTGCSLSNAQIAADGQAISTALTNVANLYTTSNPTAAADLKTAAASILAVTANWNSSTGLSIFNSAANAAEVVLAAIPQTTAFAALVPIAVAAIDVLVGSLNPASTKAVAVQAHATVAPAGNPYRGQFTIKHKLGRSLEGDFKAAWNQVALGNPELVSARL